VVLASIFSVLNKLCDIAPELLIGVAVDVVVKTVVSGRADHGVGPVPAAHDRRRRHRRVVLESSPTTSPTSLAELAQDIEHDMRMAAYSHVQGSSWPTSRTALGRPDVVLSNDVNQLERFLDKGPTRSS
jgi:ATP-binding cassette subfamily B protein